MGNRAVIGWQDKNGKFNERSTGVYVHWNGGLDSVSAFLAYCEMRGYASPTEIGDEGVKKFAKTVEGFFHGTTSIEVDSVCKLDADNYDNGLYICNGWRIVDRKYNPNAEQLMYGFAEMIQSINVGQENPIPEDALNEMIRDYVAKYGDPLEERREKKEEASSQFEIGQQVLVRDFPGDNWIAAHYAGIHSGSGMFLVFGGRQWRECIPLEGNEILIGRNGGSAEEPDWKEPEVAEYGYLQPVEVRLLSLEEWEPGHYLDADLTSGNHGLPHCVVNDKTREIDWYADEDVRLKKD